MIIDRIQCRVHWKSTGRL